jgi:hypothetical protein
MAAPIAATSTTLEPATPVELFHTRIFGGGVETQQGRQYEPELPYGPPAAPHRLVLASRRRPPRLGHSHRWRTALGE